MGSRTSKTEVGEKTIMDATVLARKYCGKTSYGENLYCNAFSGCCDGHCCKEDLTFVFVWIILAVGLLILALLACYCYRRRQFLYRKLNEPKLRQVQQGAFQVLVEDKGKPCSPLTKEEKQKEVKQDALQLVVVDNPKLLTKGVTTTQDQDKCCEDKQTLLNQLTSLLHDNAG